MLIRRNRASCDQQQNKRSCSEAPKTEEGICHVIDSLQESVDLDYRANVGVKSLSHLKRENEAMSLLHKP